MKFWTQWSIVTDLAENKNYKLLLWDTHKNTDTFKIKWKQRNTIQTCISVSYLLKDESKCTLTMSLIDEDNFFQTVESNNIAESVN